MIKNSPIVCVESNAFYRVNAKSKTSSQASAEPKEL
jgi:hypothetical protein